MELQIDEIQSSDLDWRDVITLLKQQQFFFNYLAFYIVILIELGCWQRSIWGSEESDMARTSCCC